VVVAILTVEQKKLIPYESVRRLSAILVILVRIRPTCANLENYSGVFLCMNAFKNFTFQCMHVARYVLHYWTKKIPVLIFIGIMTVILPIIFLQDACMCAVYMQKHV